VFCAKLILTVLFRRLGLCCAVCNERAPFAGNFGSHGWHAFT